MDAHIEQVFDAGMLCSEGTLRNRLEEVASELNYRSTRLMGEIGFSDELAEEVEDLLTSKLMETPEYQALIDKRDEILREYLIGKLTA